jgi:hypothetical protein
MKRFIIYLIFGSVFWAGFGCGKKGPLELPLTRTPRPAEGFSVFQRGDNAVLEWTNPRTSVDGRSSVDVEEIEIWLFEKEKMEPDVSPGPENVERMAGLAARISKKEISLFILPAARGSARISYPLDIGGERSAADSLTFSLRVKANGGRLSEFSTPVTLKIQTCARPPENLEIRTDEGFIEIRWSPPQSNVDGSTPVLIKGYTVYRSDRGRRPRRLTDSPVPGSRYLDREFEFGSVYRYFVRTCSTADEPWLESEDSTGREIVPLDIFPPEAPEGLTAIAGEDRISLSWKARPEPDLAGYRVWRGTADESDRILLTPRLVTANYFEDPSVERGVLSFYSVSALDRSGNESPRSESVALVLKEGEL